MKTILVVSFAAALVFASGCERHADISRTKTFKQDTLTFEYPQNWRVTKNQKSALARLVYVEEPGHGVVIITAYSGKQAVSLRAYTDALRSGFSKALPIGKVEKSMASGDDQKQEVAFTVNLLGVEVPHTADITLHRFADLSVICLTQVSDKDRHLVAPGFDLIRQTLGSTAGTAPAPASVTPAATPPRPH